MTHYEDLSPEQRGLVIRKLINQELTPVQAALAGAIIPGLTIDHLPTNAQLIEIKDYIRTIGYSDSLIGILNVDDKNIGQIVLRADMTVATPQERLLAGGQVSTIEARKYLGFAKNEIKDTKKVTALTEPKVYLQNKNLDIRRINNESLKTYTEAVQKYSAIYGYDEEESKAKAKTAALAVRSALMAQHNIEYPSEFQSIAEGKLKKNN
jgi:hypothetical protein